MMIRLLIALATAAALAAAGTAYADSLILYMFPGDYAAYTCQGGTVMGAAFGDTAYGDCTRKGIVEWDVTAYCFGDASASVTGSALTITCN